MAFAEMWSQTRWAMPTFRPVKCACLIVMLASELIGKPVYIGGSLGPEAALLALCGSCVSWVARHVFGARGARLRACAIMGMTAGLSAFFGVH